ncbi:translin-associated protein X-like [Centruroides sculpturatus]|uniref:translin-associated protein X-like n=1 Tax=Centruroides sculpturatus TaxID=218467 RepID=UPI000C6EFAE6|nr:translin-associated protein X-like [Centruroides sculpturatus]
MESEEGFNEGKVKYEQNKLKKRSSIIDQQIECNIDDKSPIIQVFQNFQQELDKRYDKYERLVKCSRDITIESKRIIFLLHRITGDKEQILQESEKRLKQLRRSTLRTVAKELENEDLYFYLRAYSPGLQEYVEAVTFYNYIKNERLLGLEEIQSDLTYDEETETIDGNHEIKRLKLVLVLPPLEYILGVADLTGELMRKCINSVGQGNLEEPFKLCAFLQNIHNAFGILGNIPGREISRKIFVLRQSMKKVENACYTIQVRGSEIPKFMLKDVFNSETATEQTFD